MKSELTKLKLTGLKLTQLKRYIAFSLVLVALTGCQNKNEEAPILSRAIGPRGALGANYGINGASLTGKIFTDPSYQQEFQDAVTGFLSTDVNPQYVGLVSATGRNNSGVYFAGRVALSTGSLRTFTGSYADIHPNSSLSIQVRDYSPQYPNAPALPPFTFSRAQGVIQGNQAEIIFGDSYGTVTMVGIITQNTFEGEISYDNSVSYDGSKSGAAGTLGNFSVPTCSFFSCN